MYYLRLVTFTTLSWLRTRTLLAWQVTGGVMDSVCIANLSALLIAPL